MNHANLFLTIIMFVSTYPILLILYFSQMSVVEEERKNFLFGIRCSSEWMPDSERSKLVQTYQKKMKRLLLIMALIPLVTLIIPYLSISLTIWMTWTLALIAAFLVPYAQAFRQVKELKQARNLCSDQPETSFYELKEAGCVRTLRIFDLIPLIVLNLGMALFSLLHFRGDRLQSYGTLISIFALSSLSCSALGIWMDRMKTRVVSQNSDVNINFARANKKLWKQFWVTNSWLMTIFTAILLVYCLFPSPSDKIAFWLCMLGSLLLCLTVVTQIIYVTGKKQRLDRLYEKELDPVFDQDEERHWIGGILYYNPKDRHTLVEKRVGIGSTFNMATPAGKAIAVFSALCIMLIPLSCVWLLLEEFTPINLTLQGEALVAEHISTEYVIPFDEITSVELFHELPRRSKVYGTDMSTLEKGTFRNNTDGHVEECLNPMEEVFLRVETADTIYYLGSYSEDATTKLYESLCRELPHTPPSLP